MRCIGAIVLGTSFATWHAAIQGAEIARRHCSRLLARHLASCAALAGIDLKGAHCPFHCIASLLDCAWLSFLRPYLPQSLSATRQDAVGAHGSAGRQVRALPVSLRAARVHCTPQDLGFDATGLC
jgi:hypothetical protein